MSPNAPAASAPAPGKSRGLQTHPGLRAESICRTLLRLLALCCAGAAHAAIAVQPSAATVAQQADSTLKRVVPADGPGAAVLIARGDQVLYRGARGMASLELGVKLSPQQLFRIGSVTKMFTAATVLKLVDAGQLSLQDPLSKFLPDYPGGDNITIHQLLNHTSGIKDYAQIPDVSGAQDADTAALIAIFKGQPVDFPPGTDWAYSNSGYVLLGAVIEKLSRHSWFETMRQQLLEPLHLRHTLYATDLPLVPGRVAGYSRDQHGQLTNAGYLIGPGADGALAASLDDLFNWMRALNTGQVLSPGSYQKMITPQPNNSGKPTNYGYGMMLTRVRGAPVLEHDGGISGFAAQLAYLPSQQITVVTLVNTDTYKPNAAALGHQMAAIALGQPYPEIHPVTLSESQLRPLTGVYRIDERTQRTLTLRDGVLYSQRGDGPARPLIATSPDQLYFDANSIDGMTAVRDASGAVIALDFFDSASDSTAREPRGTAAAPP